MLRRLRKSTIAKAVSSNIYIQIVQTIAQLALVPILASHWGLKVYGTWLLLSTVPSYLAMADLGLASAASNDMAAQAARGNHAIAAETYHAVRLTILFVIAGMLTISALVFYVAFPDMLDGTEKVLHGQARLIMMMMLGYGGVSLMNGVIAAGYRTVGGYAISGYIGGTILLIEVALVVAVVVYGGGILAVASVYLVTRLVGTMVFSLDLARRAPWLVVWHLRPSWQAVHRLLRPAVAVMVLPLAQAVSIQGMVAMLGLVGGVAAIPAFTAVRTLSRVIIQAILIVNHAIMPSFTLANAVADQVSTRRFTALSLATSLCFGIPGMLGLIVTGQFIVGLWTNGKLHPDLSLIVVMAVTTFLAALWLPVSNLILSINRHESFTYYYLAVTLTALAVCYPLVWMLSGTGAAISLLLIDTLMLRRVFAISRRIGIYDWRETPSMITTLLSQLTRRPGRRPS